MRKVYLVYLLVGVIIAFLAVFYLGSSTSFANYLPIGALLGAVLLFGLAAPIAIYYPRLSLYIGLISTLLILPYISMFTIQFLLDYKGMFHWSVIIILSPFIIVLISLCLTVRLLMVKELGEISSNKYLSVLLASIPIMMFLFYVILYGDQWSWEMFNIE